MSLLAMVSKQWGQSSFSDEIRAHQVDDEMEDAYNALAQGYGFSGFCNFLAFMMMFWGAVYYSPLICGYRIALIRQVYSNINTMKDTK